MKAAARFRDVLLSRKTAAFVAFAAAVVIAAVAVWWGGLNQDEGWYLYAAQSVRAGKMPYRDFFFTQGPVLPFVYSKFAPVWMSWHSPVHGVLGGRLLTLFFGVLATAVSAATARLLVPPEKRRFAALPVFVLLACNVYHVYFTSIVKTYSLSSLLLMSGFLLFSAALSLRSFRGAAPAAGRILLFSASGAAMAFASGTRISLLLAPAATGLALFFTMRRRGAAFLWFGLGLAAGLWPVYGVFAVDDASLRGLLAAQSFHASRGGFDIYNAVGSVSRLVRAYLPLFGVFAAAAVAAALKTGERARPVGERDFADGERIFALRTMAAALAAVFLLQMSAPFPYDDYQVPLAGLASAIAVACLSRALPSAENPHRCALLALVLCAGFAAFSSPLLQEWFTDGQDRFWVRRRDKSPIEQLTAVAHEIEVLDPDGDSLLTQDLYLAVECGRSVPERFEMGPFGYFPDCSDDEADALRVFNRRRLLSYLETGDLPPVAALSGYAFAIAAPGMGELDETQQTEIFAALNKRYAIEETEERFGQNGTRLLVLSEAAKKRSQAKEAAKDVSQAGEGR